MSVMQRTITIHRETNSAGYNLFDTLCDELKRSTATWAGLHMDDAQLADWPMIDHWHAEKHIWAKWWRSEHEPPHRLLTLGLEESHGGADWTISVKLGALDDERVVIFDTRKIRPLQAMLPVDQISGFLDFLTRYSCEDEDGRIANRPYVLHKKRVPDFIHFLESPPIARQLPVVLISATNSDKSYLVDHRALALRLQGLAHVVTLNQHATWWSDDLPLAHKCFDGAVRIYLPGYSRDDPPAVHRWWHKDRFTAESVAESTNEIVRVVIEINHPRFRVHRIFSQLHRELSEIRQAALMQHKLAALRQILKKEEETLFDEFYAAYEQVDSERDYWQQLARDLDDEVRALRRRINQQWETSASISAETVKGPRVLLSGQAQEAFATLDQVERDDFRKTVLNKLLDDMLRKKQSEVVSTDAGAYYVYPRGHSTNGRRVLYVLDGADVKVCELFASHDQYMNARNDGIDLRRYTAYAILEKQHDISANHI